MRYINNEDIVKKYGKKSESAGDYWRDPKLRKDIEICFYNKCWYTEASLVGSDEHVDHFRPKARVTQYEAYDYNHEISSRGYSWLRNDSSNYRGACAYANRGKGKKSGKHDYFPLKTGSYHAKIGGDCAKEEPLLIDPCKKGDVKLISFLGGRAINSEIDPGNAHNQTRFDVSEKIYNLNHEELVSERTKIWNNVLNIIECYKKSDKSDAYKRVCVVSLEAYVKPETMFSACAIACINSMAPKEIQDELNLEL